MSVGHISNVHTYCSSDISQEGSAHRNFLSAVVEGLPGAARRISAIAVPVIVIAAVSSIPQADGGPIAYGLCIAACENGLGMAGLTLAIPTGGLGALCASVAAIFACPSFCAPVLAAPTP